MPWAGSPGSRFSCGIMVQGCQKEALRLVFDPFMIRSDTPLEYGIHLMGCFFIAHHHAGIFWMTVSLVFSSASAS